MSSIAVATQSTKRFSTDIRPFSQWQVLYITTYITLVVFLLLAIGLTWIGWLIIALLTVLIGALVYGLYYRHRLRLQHLEAPNVNEVEGLWQLLHVRQQKRQLWEAQLQRAQAYPHFVQLTFRITHPMPTQKTIVIWQDQLSVEAWRQLRAIANWGV